MGFSRFGRGDSLTCVVSAKDQAAGPASGFLCGRVCMRRSPPVGRGLISAPSPGTRQRTHTRQITILNVMQSQDTPIWETHEIPAWPFNVLRDRGHVLNRDRLSPTSRPLYLRTALARSVPSISFVARIVGFQSRDGLELGELTLRRFILLTSLELTVLL